MVNTKETVVTETTEPVVTPTATGTQTVRTVSHGTFEDFFVSKTNQVIFTIISIICALILLRFLLLLLGANNVGFVNFIYNLTDLFVAPFVGIFPAQASGGAYLEWASILAIVVWMLFGFIVAMVVNMFSTRTDV